jgi:hypothetical protein
MPDHGEFGETRINEAKSMAANHCRFEQKLSLLSKIDSLFSPINSLLRFLGNLPATS